MRHQELTLSQSYTAGSANWGVGVSRLHCEPRGWAQSQINEAPPRFAGHDPGPVQNQMGSGEGLSYGRAKLRGIGLPLQLDLAASHSKNQGRDDDPDARE